MKLYIEMDKQIAKFDSTGLKKQESHQYKSHILVSNIIKNSIYLRQTQF